MLDQILKRNSGRSRICDAKNLKRRLPLTRFVGRVIAVETSAARKHLENSRDHCARMRNWSAQKLHEIPIMLGRIVDGHDHQPPMKVFSVVLNAGAWKIVAVSGLIKQ